jgi:spore maturation protein CgeB
VYDEARDIYHNTKVGFNWSSLLDTTARVYELMAMGTVPVLNRVPDLMNMFENGKDYVGFDTANEAVNHVEYYVNHPEEAEAISAQAKEAVKEHTWDARMETVLQEVGLF